MNLQNLSFARRLFVVFAAVIGIFLIVSWASLSTSSKVAEAEGWNTHTYEVLATGNDMLLSMVNMETGARGHLLAGEERFLEPWNSGLKNFDKAWTEAKKLTSDNPTQQKRLDDMKSRHLEFKAVSESLFALRKNVNAGTMTIADLSKEFALGRDKAAMDSFRTLDTEFDKMERDLLVVRAATSESQRALNRNSILGGSLLAVVLAALMGIWITRSIVRPMAQAVDIAKRVAAGDLTSKIIVTSTDETGELLSALKQMNDTLTGLVGKVRQGTDTIATASAEIAAGNMDLSSRTEQQASSLEETASSMEELTGTSKQNADNARQANKLASSASEVAVKGGAVVSQVVSTMGSINESAKKIADIIGVIDGIAFQTNILALNAAVEAARAGEQGRGFAVVASEVRSLAQRSAAAAKDIKGLINDSVEKVDAGTKLVDQAGASMSEIVDSVRRVTDIISEIAAASEEQTAGIEQVNQAIGQMDEVTQQNAALVEQAAAAAESLQDQSANLAETVSAFKLDNHGATSMAVTRMPASSATGQQRPVKKPTVLARVVPSRTAASARKIAAAPVAAAGGDWEEF